MSDLLDFGTDIGTVIRGATRVPQVTETVRVHQHQDRTHVTVAAEDWTWEQLRDYVVGEIQTRFGVFPRNHNAEMGIFKSFIVRHPGGEAAAIARYAFEIENGRWRGAPVKVTRFCKASDPYFSDVIWAYLSKNT